MAEGILGSLGKIIFRVIEMQKFERIQKSMLERFRSIVCSNFNQLYLFDFKNRYTERSIGQHSHHLAFCH